MMSFLRKLAVPVILVVAMMPAAVSAKPMTAYVKPGGSYAEFKTDNEACAAEGKAARDKVASVPYQPGAGNAIAAGIAEGLAKGKAFNDAYEACFTARGYALETLSEEDTKAYKKAKKADRDAWVEAYYTRRAAETKPAGEAAASASASAESSSSSSEAAAN